MLPSVAREQPQTGSSARTRTSAARDEELHFVSVLTLRGKVTDIERAKRRVTVTDAKGRSTIFEIRRSTDLDSLKPGDRVTVRYFEGARVGKAKRAVKTAGWSLNGGLIAAELSGSTKKRHAVFGSVDAVDAADQEITLKEPDGTTETIMVVNPEDLERLRVGDQVIVSRAEALALSIEKES